MSKSKYNIKKAKAYEKAYDLILKTNLFDEEFYSENYSDYYSGDSLEHYLFEGYKKGFDPSVNFSTNKYLNKYKDVKKAEMNPLAHYVLYGKNEGKEYFDSVLARKEEIINLNRLYLNNFRFDSEPLVSIIVLNKDGVHHLKRLLKDFSQKTNYSNFEFILVDNDSSDESVSYVKSLNVDFPLKIIENDENLSFSKANNDAVKEASGEYVLLLNNDIEPTFGWLNEMMGIMLNNENVGSVGAKLVFPYYPNSKRKSFKLQHGGDIFTFRNEKYYVYPYNQYNPGNPFGREVTKPRKVVSATAAVLLVKKSVYEDIGGLDEGYIYGYEDVDFSLKLHQKGFDIHYCSSALLFHHESSTRNVSKNRDNNSQRLISKWGDYLNRHIYLDKLNNEKFFCEYRLNILFVVEDVDNLPDSALSLAKVCREESYNLKLADNSKRINVPGSVDIILSFVQDLNIGDDLRENTIKVSCLNKDEISDLEFYDLIINKDFDNFKDILNKFILDKYNHW